MLNNGMDEIVLMGLMGHERLKTTLGYSELSKIRAARQYHAAMETINRPREESAKELKSGCGRGKAALKRSKRGRAAIEDGCSQPT
jgi:hypothetical protein